MDFLLVFVFTAGAQVTSDSGVHTKQFRLLAGESGRGGGGTPGKIRCGCATRFPKPLRCVRPKSADLHCL